MAGDVPVDISLTVRGLVGDTAAVRNVYGGLEMVVLDEKSFPWAEVLRALRAVRQDIWIRETDDRLVVLSKPRGL